MRKILLLMCIMLFSLATAFAQSHSITRKPKSSTVTKPSATRTPSSGKKTGPTTSSGKQTSRGSSGKISTPPVVQADKNPTTRISKTASLTNCPDSYHPHAIDLGLPSGTKWACCNVGAAKPEDYGGYYAWGETKEKSTYNWNTYTHCNGSGSTCHNLGSDIAGTNYDVAHLKWGGGWVMPSNDQQQELLDNCTSVWTSINGVKGRKLKGKNGGVIFLPAAGYQWPGGLGDAGSYGGFWSSTQTWNFHSAFYLYFDSSGVERNADSQYYGHSVRPIFK